MSDLPRAFGPAVMTAALRSQVEDFQVTVLSVALSGFTVAVSVSYSPVCSDNEVLLRV